MAGAVRNGGAAPFKSPFPRSVLKSLRVKPQGWATPVLSRLAASVSLPFPGPLLNFKRACLHLPFNH